MGARGDGVAKKRGETKVQRWKVRQGQLNRFHPISDAVNSNQRSFPFGLWQTIGLITDRDKARAVAICARISDVPNLLPFLPFLSLLFPSLHSPAPRFPCSNHLSPRFSALLSPLSFLIYILSSKSACTDREVTRMRLC